MFGFDVATLTGFAAPDVVTFDFVVDLAVLGLLAFDLAAFDLTAFRFAALAFGFDALAAPLRAALFLAAALFFDLRAGAAFFAFLVFLVLDFVFLLVFLAMADTLKWASNQDARMAGRAGQNRLQQLSAARGIGKQPECLENQRFAIEIEGGRLARGTVDLLRDLGHARHASAVVIG